MREQAGIAEILAQFPGLVATAIEPLENAGGFSGADLWRVSAAAGNLCLRRWPAEHPSWQRLAWIHHVLQHVARRGFTKLPVPRISRDGSTIIERRGRLWELTPWLPGRADFHSAPTNAKLEAALRALAEFHRLAAEFANSHGVPPGIEQRRQQLDRLVHGAALRIVEGAQHQMTWPDLPAYARRLWDIFQQTNGHIRQLLEWATQQKVALQPCIADIWHDHVFFQGDMVSGLIDFGALRIDHVASDLSRLLGSLVGDDPVLRGIGLNAYQSLRPLDDAELMLIECYDRSGLLLAGMNWLEWIAIEQRHFPDQRRVLQRLDTILARLE